MGWIAAIGMTYMTFLFWRTQGRNGLLCAIGIATVFTLGALSEKLTAAYIPPHMKMSTDLLHVTIAVLAIVAVLLYWAPRFGRRDRR